MDNQDLIDLMIFVSMMGSWGETSQELGKDLSMLLLYKPVTDLNPLTRVKSMSFLLLLLPDIPYASIKSITRGAHAPAMNFFFCFIFFKEN